MRREGLQARGIYKEVPRPSRRLALATRQKIPYINTIKSLYIAYIDLIVVVSSVSANSIKRFFLTPI
jgi:hypothetical protein